MTSSVEFIKSKGLWEEYCIFYTEKRLSYVNKENRKKGIKQRQPKVSYVPKITKDELKIRNEKIKELRSQGKTLKEIGDMFNLCSQSILYICKE